MTIEKHVYGWRRDLPDFRDYKYSVRKGEVLPSEVDLRNDKLHIVDQGSAGSCVGCGIANVLHAVQLKQNKPNHFYPSRLFIYYNSREAIGTVQEDSGACIRDGVKSIAKYGACSEECWPYIIPKFREKASPECYSQALENQAIIYESVNQDLYSLKYAISQGFPIVGGISIYESFEAESVAKTGIIPLPKKGESLLGGHCVSFFGYSDRYRFFIGMNSWGENWANKGYFYIPYSYITNRQLASDFWVIKLVE